MNLDRAREFYSAYYEGGLDDGLRQAFQRALGKDQRIADEYSQFVRIMGELKNLDSPIAVPADLHDRIWSRLDEAEKETRRSASHSSRFYALRPLAYGAAATIAIIATIVSISAPSQGTESTAGFGPVMEKAPAIVSENGEVVLAFTASGKNSVSLARLSDAGEIMKIEMEGQTVHSPLHNSRKEAEAVRISFGQRYEPIVVIVPGTQTSLHKTGTGTLFELLKAASDQYRVPFVVAPTDQQTSVEWTFDEVDPVIALKDELNSIGLKAELRSDGVVQITAN